MKRHWVYFKYVLKHKWFVFLAGRKLKVPLWCLLLHDWDKFTPGMWIPYARTFRKPNGEEQYEPSEEFYSAWNGHEKRNKHHWQYWVLLKDSGELVPLPIPDKHRREMLADWIGAGMALGKPDTKQWYLDNHSKMHIHDDTRLWIEKQLSITWVDYLGNCKAEKYPPLEQGDYNELMEEANDWSDKKYLPEEERLNEYDIIELAKLVGKELGTRFSNTLTNVYQNDKIQITVAGSFPSVYIEYVYKGEWTPVFDYRGLDSRVTRFRYGKWVAILENLASNAKRRIEERENEFFGDLDED